MKTGRFLLVLLTLLMMSISTFAQKQNFSGTVLDDSGMPIIGASVVEKGSSNGAITDIDGNFTLSVEPGTTLVVSYLGYKSVELKAIPNMRVELQEDSQTLDNLVVIVDNNGLQIDGPVDQVCSPYPIDKKFEAFNFHVINIDAHDFDQIRAAFEEAKQTKGMPTAIVAKSTKGKGVSFMENQVGWHGKAPNDEEYAKALA